MDAVLLEAFFAFYWLSNGRKSSVGMSGAIQYMIELVEVREYYNTFIPKMDYDHFLRVIRAADSEYMQIQAENMKRTQEANEAKRK